MSESEIIKMIQRAAKEEAHKSVPVGIGDDAAVVGAPNPNEEVLATTDQVIENTHFVRGEHPPRALGHKLAARGLSDIAAMGGTPRFSLVSLCLPAWTTSGWIRHFISGFLALAKETGVVLIGGDVARGDRFVGQATLLGSVPRGRALLRSGALSGDLLYVSGYLGGSALGLERLQNGNARGVAVRRHLYPEPRLRLGRYLRQTAKATSVLDLSDGLSTDARRLAEASGVGIEIEASRVPRFQGASLEQALHGGEEYELLFTARPDTRVPVRQQGLPLTRIGTIRRQKGVVLTTERETIELLPKGFDHFRRP